MKNIQYLKDKVQRLKNLVKEEYKSKINSQDLADTELSFSALKGILAGIKGAAIQERQYRNKG